MPLRGPPRRVQEPAFHPCNVPAPFPMSRYVFRNIGVARLRN
ncbi:protein of unknown function [Burkholderia multivorans]